MCGSMCVNQSCSGPVKHQGAGQMQICCSVCLQLKTHGVSGINFNGHICRKKKNNNTTNKHHAQATPPPAY